MSGATSGAESGGELPGRSASGSTRPCPFCAEGIHVDALKCKHCGEFVDDEELALRINAMSPYERDAYREILAWQNEEPSTLSKVWHTATVPFTTAVEKAVPDSLTDGMADAIYSGMQAVQELAMFTTSKEAILKFSAKKGESVDSIDDFATLDLKHLDSMAGAFISDNNVLAFVEGAGIGLGGVVMLLADIPALMTINLRALVQLSYIYGFDAQIPKEKEYVVRLLGMGSADQAGKAAGLQHVNGILTQIARGKTWKELEKSALVRLMQAIARQLGIRLTKRKLAQLLPIVGLGVAAGVNYHHTKSTALAGYMLYRKRYLAAKHGVFDER